LGGGVPDRPFQLWVGFDPGVDGFDQEGVFGVWSGDFYCYTIGRRSATELAWKLDRQGITIPGPDLVIAASAMKLGAAVMTSDAHFSRIDGLRVIESPAAWFGS
jgi:hypothetical protein